MRVSSTEKGDDSLLIREAIVKVLV